MIHADHPPLHRYALLTGFLILLFVPLLGVLFAERWFPRERGETVNVPRYMNSAVPLSSSLYLEETRIALSIPDDGATYLGKRRVTQEELIDGIKKLAEERPANERTVYLKGGVGVSYESIIEALQSIRAGGIDRVRLVVKKEKGASGDKGGFLEVKLPAEVSREQHPQGIL